MENIIEEKDKLVELVELVEESKKSKEENDKLYIVESRRNIDNFINKREYRKAFGLLILVLERLDDGKMTRDFIDYYSKNMANMGIFDNVFPSS